LLYYVKLKAGRDLYSKPVLARHAEGNNFMKTIILYATKYGATAEVARLIAEKFDDAIIHDLKQAYVPVIDDFDCVIIQGIPGQARHDGLFIYLRFAAVPLFL